MSESIAVDDGIEVSEGQVEQPESNEQNETIREEPIDLDEADESEDLEEPEEGFEEEEQEEEELVEFTFGSEKLSIPKSKVPDDVREKLDQFSKGIWSKFTKDQQVNVETAKSLNAQREVLDKLTTLQGDALNAYSRGLRLKSDIEQLQKVDLRRLWQENPDQARRISDTLSAKEAEFQRVIAHVNQSEQQVESLKYQEYQQRSEEGKRTLDAKYKNFSSEKAPQVVDYVVKKYGFSKEEADTWSSNWKITDMAYKAMRFDEMQERAKSAKPKQTTKPVKALKTKGAASSPTRDPEKMSMEEYAKWRASGGR